MKRKKPKRKKNIILQTVLALMFLLWVSPNFHEASVRKSTFSDQPNPWQETP